MTKRKDPADIKKAGRKSDYLPEFVEVARAYIEECMTVEEGKERELPSRVGLALRLKTSNVTLKAWGAENPLFLASLRNLDNAQHQQLINRGLNGTGNSTITKLMMMSNHGYKEKSDVTSNDETIKISLPEKFKDI
jgi:hypothetical protein